jgi:hypothetical protein
MPIRSFTCTPERWPESRMRTCLDGLLPGLRGKCLYSQVPAISCGERGMLDLLTLDRDGRLVVPEVKMGEDMHLPLQGLDDWFRVRALNVERQVIRNREVGAFERQAYFAGAAISARPPNRLLTPRRCAFILPMRLCCGIFRHRWRGS